MTYLEEFNTLQESIVQGLSKPSTLKSIFGNVSDEFWCWAFTEGYDENPLLRQILPGLPSPQIQENYTGRSGHPALKDAFAAYTLFKQLALQHGKAINQCKSILDFGCGWGRIIRFFLKDVDERDVFGVDCSSEMITLCGTQQLRGTFLATAILPPTHFGDSQFDLIYLYSVFSHLSEDAHLAWLQEFHRLLKPGGLVIATTRPRSFITLCAELARKPDLEVWQRGAAASFADPEEALARYEAGQFVHSPTGGGGCLDRSFYGESCISEQYARQQWTKYYSSVDYLRVEQHYAIDQNIIVAVK